MLYFLLSWYTRKILCKITYGPRHEDHHLFFDTDSNLDAESFVISCFPSLQEYRIFKQTSIRDIRVVYQDMPYF